MALLEIEDLRVAFRRRHGLRRSPPAQALRGVTLAARPGEVLALVGASGAGKSLVLLSALGLLPPNAAWEGQVRLDGVPLRKRDLPALRGRRLAYLPQSVAALDPLVPVGRQIGWAARRAGAPRTDAAGALHAFGLAPDTAALHPGALSGGMARRVLLLAALAGEADVVLADEPTANLDPANAQAALARLRALADRGRAVLLVTHDLPAALPVADRIALMRDGRILSEERPADFAADGAHLGSPWARELWQALPGNGFGDGWAAHARSA